MALNNKEKEGNRRKECASAPSRLSSCSYASTSGPMKCVCDICTCGDHSCSKKQKNSRIKTCKALKEENLTFPMRTTYRDVYTPKLRSFNKVADEKARKGRYDHIPIFGVNSRMIRFETTTSEMFPPWEFLCEQDDQGPLHKFTSTLRTLKKKKIIPFFNGGTTNQTFFTRFEPNVIKNQKRGEYSHHQGCKDPAFVIPCYRSSMQTTMKDSFRDQDSPPKPTSYRRYPPANKVKTVPLIPLASRKTEYIDSYGVSPLWKDRVLKQPRRHVQGPQDTQHLIFGKSETPGLRNSHNLTVNQIALMPEPPWASNYRCPAERLPPKAPSRTTHHIHYHEVCDSHGTDKTGKFTPDCAAIRYTAHKSDSNGNK